MISHKNFDKLAQVMNMFCNFWLYFCFLMCFTFFLFFVFLYFSLFPFGFSNFSPFLERRGKHGGIQRKSGLADNEKNKGKETSRVG